MRRALLALLAVELLCFGPHFLHTGFYLDDWALLRMMLPRGRLDFSAGVAAFAAAYWNRPLQILHYPLLIAFGGLSPWRYRLVIAGLELLAGSLLFAWLRRATRDAGLSVLAAALALTYPAYGSVHVWWTMTTQWASLCLVLTSMILHARHRERRDARPFSSELALGQLCYLLALLEYESFAFLPLALAAPLWLQSRAAPKIRGAAVARSLSPFAVTFAAATLAQRVVFPWFWGPAPRPVAFSPGHVLDVYRAGLACLTFESARLIFDSGEQAARSFPAYAWIALILGAAAAAVAVGDGGRGSVETRAARRVLAASGGLLILASYIPYAVSGVYTPRIHGVMNRVNMGGGLGAGLLAAALLCAVPSRKWGAPLRRVSVGAALAAFALCHWTDGERWSSAWSRERELAREIAASLPPGPVTVLLKTVPGAPEEAPVFQNQFDLSAALALLAGREVAAADFVYNGRTERDAAVITNGDGNTSRYPYEGLYVFDEASRRLYPLKKP